MGIESLNSNIINSGSYSNYKSNVDVPSSPEAPEIEKPELQDVQLPFQEQHCFGYGPDRSGYSGESSH